MQTAKYGLLDIYYPLTRLYNYHGTDIWLRRRMHAVRKLRNMDYSIHIQASLLLPGTRWRRAAGPMGVAIQPDILNLPDCMHVRETPPPSIQNRPTRSFHILVPLPRARAQLVTALNYGAEKETTVERWRDRSNPRYIRACGFL